MHAVCGKNVREKLYDNLRGHGLIQCKARVLNLYDETCTDFGNYSNGRAHVESKLIKMLFYSRIATNFLNLDFTSCISK